MGIVYLRGSIEHINLRSNLYLGDVREPLWTKCTLAMTKFRAQYWSWLGANNPKKSNYA